MIFHIINQVRSIPRFSQTENWKILASNTTDRPSNKFPHTPPLTPTPTPPPRPPPPPRLGKFRSASADLRLVPNSSTVTRRWHCEYVFMYLNFLTSHYQKTLNTFIRFQPGYQRDSNVLYCEFMVINYCSLYNSSCISVMNLARNRTEFWPSVCAMNIPVVYVVRTFAVMRKCLTLLWRNFPFLSFQESERCCDEHQPHSWYKDLVEIGISKPSFQVRHNSKWNVAKGIHVLLARNLCQVT